MVISCDDASIWEGMRFDCLVTSDLSKYTWVCITWETGGLSRYDRYELMFNMERGGFREIVTKDDMRGGRERWWDGYDA
jgi:hypothetical protein